MIIDQIKTHGPIAFVDFMQQALYHPRFGYYSSGLPKFGVMGDFITAPELTALFGYTIANQLAEVLKAVEHPHILEFGAGSGKLCIDILTQLERLDVLPEQYLILDVSASLKERQFEAIKARIPHLIDRVSWLDALPEKPINGVVIANEVLDAMPVHQFIQTKDGLFERYVGVDEQDNLITFDKPLEDKKRHLQIAEKIPKEVTPYLSEINPFMAGWTLSCSHVIAKGMLLVIDYGFPQQEYYHPDRSTGTLMCHHQHKSHTNPLLHVGEQDITAHVDFTALAEAGLKAGFEVVGYTNQGSFLLANHILQFLSKLADGSKKVKETQAIKQLIQENEMGELFKVMALTKNIDVDLTGFKLSDKRHVL